MYTYRYRYIIPDIMQPMLDFSAKKHVKSPTHFGLKSTQNLKICMQPLRSTHFILLLSSISAPF